MANNSFIVAVDGPAAAGKGTLSQRVSAFYQLAYLDTGILYRGVSWIILSQGQDPRNEEVATAIARQFTLEALDGADIRSPEIGRTASIVAVHKGVRAALLDFQRNFAHHPPDGRKGAVLDGRDIGTIICPDAAVKLFIDASPEVRAHRRWLETQQRDASISEESILAEIKRRDARDSSRDAAPMKPAADAHLIDTSQLSIDAAFAAACRVIDRAIKGGDAAQMLEETDAD
ncbi:MAG: (d)CMP kinase [bacterium]